VSKEIFDILMEQWTGQDVLPEVTQALQGRPELIPVSSSNLAAVGYDKNRHELTIAFLDGSIYLYSGVPEEEYIGLMTAYDSHGSYFVDNIRLVYSYERIAG
jgi:KTSC domain